MLHHVAARAATKGLIVNDKKTGLLCVSASTSFTAKAVLKGRDGLDIEDSGKLKIL